MNRTLNIILLTCLLLSVGLNIDLLTTEETPVIVEVDRVVTQYRVVSAVEYSPEPIPVILTEEQRIDGYIVEICGEYDMDPNLIRSIVWKESRGNIKALGDGGKSKGLMQVSIRWHKERAVRLGVTDFQDPYSNILLGVDYLSELIRDNKDVKLALMLYNMKHTTARAMYKEGKISDYATSVLYRAKQLSIGGI